MPLDAENFSASTHIFKFKIQKKNKKTKKKLRNWEVDNKLCRANNTKSFYLVSYKLH